ncbi:uncharacterized protein BCR38DRAFT_500536 [Pseudomassariella vexata]|uniref:Uncharacterized protein n=1 Tax=Pseudomassariella vexata TaxID=1141098 RepID=A0A1Y2DH46_9PEZI|nr:uncharacterized protein BCR38DRAFT_500536 [Pseudomassariella vexata]ORY58580.1 hypothetical protein BCR38DRAFT_500536 [Pseudomassariella vexata]
MFDWESTNVNKAITNDTWIEELQNLDEETPLALIDQFLEIPRHSERWFSQARVIESICSDATLSALRTRTTKASSELAVWIDDRNTKGQPREYNGPLPLLEWVEKLKLRRFGDDDHIDADVRRIQIPNPTSLTVGVLILSASKYQKPVIRDLLWRHLGGHASFQSHFGGGRFFVLEFHLPFFVWRDTQEARKDTRQKGDGSPLRHSTNLAFLSKPDPSSGYEIKQDFLHEAQFSHVTTGCNNSMWTSCSLSDTYFYDDQEDPENPDLLAYYEDEDETCDMPTMGVFDTEYPVLDPREYHLIGLKTRLGQVADEWDNIVARLKYKIRSHVSTAAAALVPSLVSPLMGFYGLGGSNLICSFNHPCR